MRRWPSRDRRRRRPEVDAPAREDRRRRGIPTPAIVRHAVTSCCQRHAVRRLHVTSPAPASSVARPTRKIVQGLATGGGQGPVGAAATVAPAASTAGVTAGWVVPPGGGTTGGSDSSLREVALGDLGRGQAQRPRLLGRGRRLDVRPGHWIERVRVRRHGAGLLHARGGAARVVGRSSPSPPVVLVRLLRQSRHLDIAPYGAGMMSLRPSLDTWFRWPSVLDGASSTSIRL